MDIELEPLGENDIDFRWRVFDATMKPFVERHTGIALDDLQSMLAGQLRGDRHQAIVVDGRRAGVLFAANEGDHLAIHQLEILPGFQGRGVGTAVITQLISQSQRERLPLKLHVFNDNARALELYERLGFVTERVDQDTVQMRRDPVPDVPE